MEENQDTFIKSHEFDYKKYNSYYPKYQYTRVLPQAGVNYIGSVAGGDQIVFEIPPMVYNLSKSYLSYQFQLLDTNVTANFNWTVMDNWTHFRQINFANRGGQYLAQIFELPNYLELVWNAETKFSDYINYDFEVPAQGATIPGPLPIVSGPGFGRLLCASPGLATNVNVRFDNTNSSIPNNEPLHLSVSAANGGAGTGQLTYSVQIPLSMIYNTIFSYDKDLFLVHYTIS